MRKTLEPGLKSFNFLGKLHFNEIYHNSINLENHHFRNILIVNFQLIVRKKGCANSMINEDCIARFSGQNMWQYLSICTKVLVSSMACVQMKLEEKMETLPKCIGVVLPSQLSEQLYHGDSLVNIPLLLCCSFALSSG